MREMESRNAEAHFRVARQHMSLRNISLEWFDRFDEALGFAQAVSMLGYGSLIIPSGHRFNVQYLPKA
jgi:hypothetical protein